MHAHNTKCISVEGNIGAGKSTLLKIISNYCDAQIVYEPLERWQNIGGENLLNYFYTDPHRWSYTFQNYAFITRIENQQEHARINKQPVQVIERSIYSDRYCFALNAYETGLMISLEWHIYKQWFDWLAPQYAPNLSGFIYLQADPEVCAARIVRRNRAEENSMLLEYLKRIHEKHEQWLIKKHCDNSIKNIPVLILTSNEDFEHNINLQKEYILKIKEFFHISCS